MASLLPDNIDFSAYMEDTDHEHKVRPASAFADDVVAFYHSASGPVGDVLPWKKTHDLLRFRAGEVTGWTGTNGHGKSLALGQIAVGFAGQRRRVCIASMEMKPAMTLARMCRQAHGADHPPVEFIRDFHRMTDKRLYFYDQQGSVRAEKMLAVVRYCGDRLKVHHFVIDSLMKCGMDEDDYNAQKRFVDALTVIAKDYGMHIHLVMHSRKGKDEFSPPGKMDVRGGGSLTDLVDNVITVWRNKGKERDRQDGKKESQDADCLLICDKQRNGDWEGKIGLWFHQTSTQYVEYATSPALDMLGGLQIQAVA